jgi:5-carboxymethyl-2-hydroxymuconate isomerase
MMTEHFADVFKKRSFALSMEFNEFSNATYKKNNVHTRFKKALKV